MPTNATFWELAESIFSSENFIPDLWLKKIDPNQNCVSKLSYEWQDPNKKIVDAVNSDGSLGIESVYKEREYVVALVKKGERVRGFPIGKRSVQ